MGDLSHVIMIRSAYSNPVMSEERLRLTRAVTVPSLAGQSSKDFTLAVLIDPRDPLRAERQAAFEETGAPVRFLPHRLVGGFRVQDNMNLAGPWGLVAGPNTLQTRMDDDDALARTFVERVQGFAYHENVDAVFTFPSGFVWSQGVMSQRRYADNQFLTLLSKRNHVYVTTHNDLAKRARTVVVDKEPGWLWVRHPQAISILNGKNYHPTHTDARGARALFDVDWSALE